MTLSYGINKGEEEEVERIDKDPRIGQLDSLVHLVSADQLICHVHGKS